MDYQAIGKFVLVLIVLNFVQATFQAPSNQSDSSEDSIESNESLSVESKSDDSADSEDDNCTSWSESAETGGGKFNNGTKLSPGLPLPKREKVNTTKDAAHPELGGANKTLATQKDDGGQKNPGRSDVLKVGFHFESAERSVGRGMLKHTGNESKLGNKKPAEVVEKELGPPESFSTEEPVDYELGESVKFTTEGPPRYAKKPVAEMPKVAIKSNPLLIKGTKSKANNNKRPGHGIQKKLGAPVSFTTEDPEEFELGESMKFTTKRSPGFVKGRLAKAGKPLSGKSDKKSKGGNNRPHKGGQKELGSPVSFTTEDPEEFELGEQIKFTTESSGEFQLGETDKFTTEDPNAYEFGEALYYTTADYKKPSSKKKIKHVKITNYNGRKFGSSPNHKQDERIAEQTVANVKPSYNAAQPRKHLGRLYNQFANGKSLNQRPKSMFGRHLPPNNKHGEGLDQGSKQKYFTGRRHSKRSYQKESPKINT